ncbi:short chain dehydrogenase [Lentzea xinjiangensis]|uniref:Short chain dehydrogenase n=1 Tax=Lentzea xinjiangensis TaxID=402600 RepID=A0A1H9UDZ3_9PSEU|nr:SDR family NAD(P)-dependent oxidoreductase [Lentzea xinjiangensis]SES07478.1 short chain dehydrogenase [Lentzea xinjiangensis]
MTSPAAVAIRDVPGRPDLVVANAGVMLGAPFAAADPGEWDRMIDVNLRALLATGRTFVEDLFAAADAGRPADLVNVGSIAAEVVFADYPVYGATKAAVTQLTRNLRVARATRRAGPVGRPGLRRDRAQRRHGARRHQEPP